jgi:hypothetical protein
MEWERGLRTVICSQRPRSITRNFLRSLVKVWNLILWLQSLLFLSLLLLSCKLPLYFSDSDSLSSDSEWRADSSSFLLPSTSSPLFQKSWHLLFIKNNVLSSLILIFLHRPPPHFQSSPSKFHSSLLTLSSLPSFLTWFVSMR